MASKLPEGFRVVGTAGTKSPAALPEGFGPVDALPPGPIINDNPMRADMPPGMSEAGGNAETGYTPSQIPGLGPDNPVNKYGMPVIDAVNALGNTFTDNIPWVGEHLKGVRNQVDAAFASAIEGREVTPEERARISTSEQLQYPVASAAGAVLGNVLPLAPLAAVKAGQYALGLAGPPLLRLAMGGASGGLIAGTDALMDGKTPEEVKNAAAWGTGLGAVGGAASPWIDDALSWLGRTLGIRSPEVADNLSRPARENLQQIFSGDNALGPQGMDAIRAGGNRGMLVDASPSSISTLDTAIARGGAGARSARDAVEARAADANTTVNNALDGTLGTPRGIKSTETELRDGSAAARKTTYDRAYSRPIDYASGPGRRIESLVSRVPKNVIDEANLMMKLEGYSSRQILAKVADDGTVTFLRQPDVMQIDYITRSLNSAAHGTIGQGKLGGMTDIGRAYGNLGRELRDVTRYAVPEYDVALRTAAHPIQQREALRYGEELLNPNLARDEAREVIEGFTKPQMDMVRQGVRSRVDEVLANVRDIVSNPNIEAQQAIKAVRDLSSKAVRDKIRMIMDDPADANRLFGELAKAQKALELRANVATNSRTYGRTDASQRFDDYVEGGAGGALLRGEPLNAGKRVVQNVTGRTPAGERAMKDKMWAETANALTLQGDEAIDMLSSLAYRNSRPKPQGVFLPGLAQIGDDYGPPIISR